MPVTAKVAPHGQLAEQETVLREVDTIALNEASDVSLNLHPRDIEMMTRQGDNLLVTLENGELITVENFYADPTELSHLYLQGDEFAGELFQVGLGEAGAGGAVPFTSTATLTTAETALTTAAAGAGTAGAGAAAGAGTVAGISTAGLVAGGVAVAAGVGVAAATGNDSSSSDEDTTAPEAPVLDETNGNILTGSSEPGTTIEVTNAAGDSVGSAVADADGNFSVELSPVQAAGTELTATATDAAGNVSEASTAVTVPQDADTTAPNTPTIAAATDDVEAITGALEDGDSTNDTTPTLGGTAEVGSTVTVSLDGDVIGTTTADSNGAWSFTPNTELGDGEHVFSVTATDAAGNESAPSGEFTLSIDTEAPVAPVLNDSDGTTASGTAEAGSDIEITNSKGDSVGTGVAEDDNTFSIELDPAQQNGEALTATATDPAGNTSSSSTPATVDTSTDSTAPNTPTITSATDDVAANTGALASGDSTNDAKPTLTGSAEAGSTVTITHNGEVVDTVVADANGSWSYTPSTDLTEGDHVFSVTATDAAGNESAPSGEFTLTVDTIAPDAPTLSETDGETANGSTVNGSAEAGGTVQITNGDGDLLGSGTVADDGTFSVTLFPKQEAGAELTATVTDAAGNESAVSDALVVPEDADVTAPNTPTIASATDDVEAMTGALASGDSTNDAAPTLTGSAEAGSTVTITHNGEVVDSVTADANGAWSYTPSTDLTEGDHVFSVTATDAAGNESAPSGEFTLTVDTIAPDAPTLSETDGETANGSTVNGSAEAGGTVQITNGDGDLLGSGTVADDGTFSVTLFPKQEAGAELTATVTDAAGNESAVSDALVVPEDADVTAPNTPTIASATDDVEAMTGALASGDSTNDAAPTLTGSAEAGSTVTITHNGEVVDSVTADANGSWGYTPSTDLTDGDHVFSVTATDAAGNESAASGEFTLTVDTSAPDAPVLSETDGTTVAGTGEAGTSVEVTNANDDVLGTAVVDAEGNFSVELSPEQEAGSTLTATATDPAGNESEASAALDVPEDADVTAPNTPTITSATDDVPADTGALASGDSTNDATPTLTGSAEAGSTVTITHNGEEIATVTADANGAWSFTPGTEFADGEHVFSVTATDEPGNVSVPSDEFTLTVDTSAPDAPVLSETDGETANGSAEAGGTVEITNGDGDLLGSGTVADDGTFSITLSPKQEAGAVLTATVTDAAGNESPVSDTLVVPEAADVTAPNTPTIASATDDVEAVTGALASGDSTNDATPTLTGSAEAGSTVTVTHNGEVIGTTIADSNGTWSFTPGTEFADGEHVFSVTATDAAGNESAPSGEFTLSIDTEAPVAPVLNDSDGTTASGTAEAGSDIELTNSKGDSVGTGVAEDDGTFSIELDPAQQNGEALTATATDPAGNTSSSSTPATVDTSTDSTAPNAPTITSATDDVPADTGALASGDSTNDATPTLTGSAEAGSTVTITHNGEVVDTVVADTNGAWSYTPSTDLTEGDHVFSVTATDAAGNESAASGEFTLTVDTTAPDAPILSETDGETANGSTVNGSAEAGGTVEITNGDGDLLGSGTVADDGTFSVTLSPKQEAGAELTATVTDAAGNESAVSDALVVPEDADVTAPNTPTIASATDDVEAVTGALASGDSTNDATPTLTGSAEAGSTVTITHNGEVVDSVTADANGSWSYTPSTDLTDGDHVFSVNATDAAGNESAPSDEFTLTVDTTAPDAPILSETDGETANGSTVNGSAEAGGTVEVTNGDGDLLGSGTVADDGTFSITLSPKQEAGAELTATVTDAAGNESPASDTLVVPEAADVTAPNTPTIASATDDVAADTGALASGDSTNDATPTLTGSAEAGSSVTITHNGEVVDTVVADANGAWSYTPSTDLTDGDHVFSVTATDTAGNESAASGEFTLTVDTAAPDAPVLSETDGTTVAGTGEAGTTVEITNANDDVVGTAIVDAEGNFSVELSPEQEAGSTLTATATDAAGNESEASAALDVPVDADVTAPNTPTIASATDDVAADTGALASGDSTNDATPTLTGSAEAGSSVTITHNGEVVDTVVADANGAWSYTPSTDLTDGDHVFSVTATDAAGNESAASGEFTLTVDTAAPDAPVLSETDGTTVAGTGETGTTVEITNANDDVVGTAVVDAEGNFSVELSPEQEAGSTLTATATDAAGNESEASAALDVPVDADVTAPNTPTITSATDDVAADTGALASGDSTNDATPTLTGSAEIGSTVTVTHNGEVIGTTIAGSNGTWSFTPGTEFADGEHVFSVTATDAAGNESAASGEFTLTVDTSVPTSPALALSNDTGTDDDGITSNGDVTVSDLEAGATWEYSLDGGSNWIAGTGTTFTLDEGVYTDGVVQIRQTDVAGNVSDAVNLGAVTVDATAPTGSIAFVDGDDGLLNLADISAVDLTGSIEAGLDSSNVVITITDSADPANEITVATTDITVDGAGNLSVTGLDLSTATSGLTEGALTVSMTVTDVAGNTFETDGTTTSDLTVPDAPSLALTTDTNVTDDGITSNGDVTVSGLEADASWEYSLNGGSNWIAGTGTTFTLDEGVYTDGVVQIRQTDVAGNVSDAVNLGAVTVDVTAPTGSIAFVDGDDGLLNLADISAVDLTGSIEAGLDSSNVVITITDSADPANEITVATTDITVDGAGNLSVTGLDLSTATSGLTEGALTVSMTVTDVAGNTFETDGTTTSDLTVPDAPSLALTTDTNVTNDGITSNGEVTVSGLEADASWEYSLNGGSNWIAGTGTTFTLDEGVYTDGVVQIRQTDVAGNVSDAVNLGAVTVDATAPTGSIAFVDGDDGLLNLADISAVDLTGSIEAGLDSSNVVITITDSADPANEITVATTDITVDGAGNLSVTGLDLSTATSGLTEGALTVSMTVTDVAGNTFETDGTTTSDLTVPDAPSLALTTDTNVTNDGITSNGDVTVSGLEADASWEYSLNGGSNWIAGTGTTFTLDEGVYTDGVVQIRQTDVAGNVSDAVNLGAVTVDATAPTGSIAFVDGDDGLLNLADISAVDLTGSIEAGLDSSNVVITITDSADPANEITVATTDITVDGAGNLSVTGLDLSTATSGLTEGALTVSMTVTDVAGNTFETDGTTTSDLTVPDAPSLALTTDTNVTNDGITSNGEVTVSGLEADASWEYSLNGGSNWIAGTGTTFTLDEGVYTDGVVQIRQTDVAGNVSDAVNLGAVTVDATAPTGSIAFVDGDDGLLNLADISAVDLTGSIEAGLDSSNVVITITDSADPANEITVATTDITVDGAGNLSVTGLDLSTATSGLTEGALTVSMTVTDVAGNTFETDGTTTSDLTVPDAPSLALTTDTNVTNDGITSNGDVTVSGLEADASWEYSLNGGSNWIAGTGTTFTLDEGVYTDGVVQIRQTDVAGNVSDAVNLGAVTVDATAPTGSIAFVDGDDGLLNLADISAVDLTGSIEAGLDSSNVVITITDSADPANEITVATTDITVDGAGNLSVTGLDLSTATSGLTEGALTVSMTVTDVAGNTFETDGTTTSDLTVPDAPSLALTTDTNVTNDGITSNGEVTASGLEADASWEYSLNGGSNWIAGTGTTFTLDEGVYTDGVVQIRQTDVAGNVSDAVNLGAVTVDATAPTGSIAFVDGDDGLLNLADISAVDLTGSIEAGLDSSNVVITITDSADPANEITVATTDITVDGAGNLSVTGLDLSTATSGLTEGALTVSMTVTDVAGNTFETDGTTTSDLTVPDAPSLALTTDTNVTNDGITSNGEVTVSGLEADASWEYSLNGGSNWIAGTGTTFTLDEGVYTDGVVQIRQTDVAGNVSDAVNLGAVTVDATAPTGSIAFVDGDDGLLNLADISAVDLTGSIEAGLDSSNVVITITDSADPANEITVATTDITVDGAGNLSVTGLDLSTATSGLTEGALTVSMTVTDVAGNTFETDGTTTSDLTVPDAPSLALTTDTNVTDDGITSNGEVTVSGLEADASWEYSLNGGSNWIAGTGTTFTLDEGVYTDGVVQVRQTDVAGNVSDAVNLGAVTIDTTAPLESVINFTDADGDINAAEATDVTFEGTVEAGLTSSNLTIVITDTDNGSVSVPTENITVSAAGEVTVSGVDLTGLAEGLLTVTMTVTDDAGNENVAAVTDTATKLSDDFLVLGNTNRLTIEEALVISATAVASTQTFADTSGEATLSLSSTESLTSNGQALDWVVTDEGRTLTLASDVDNAAATAVMVVSVTEDGSEVVYSAELLGNIDQANAESSTVDVLVTLTDGASSTSSTLNIDITDDVPTIAASTVVETLSSNTDYTGSIFDGEDDFGFGADAANGQVQSFAFKGLTFTVSDDGTYADVTGTSIEIGLEAGDTVSIVDGILAVETLSGESFSLNINSGDYSYSHQGQFSATEAANTRPQANVTESDGVLGLVGVNILDIVTLSNDQLYSVYDAEDNVASITITADGIINTVTDYLDAISEELNALLDTLSLVPGVPTVSELIDILVGNSSWTYSEELAAELGLTVTDSASGESTQSITITKIDGSEITNIEINELLASVDFTVSSAGILTGLLSLLDLDSLADSILSTTTIYATDSLAASSSDSDASLANVDLLTSDYVVPVDEGTTGNDSVNASQAGSNLYGYAGNDTLNGGSGSNILRGGNDDDTLDGGAGSDLLIGGSGNDSLDGGAGVDVIRWEAGDEGTVAAAATDTVLDLSNGGTGAGDILDLRDMLNGAYYVDSATNNLASYVSAEYVSAAGATVLYINTEGGLTADPAASANQVINIDGLDLTEGGTLTSSEVIDSLISGEQLLVGTEVNESDVSVTVVDGDGDTATGEITFVGEESLDAVTNTAPIVTLQDSELLGLVGLEALDLIDLSNNKVFVADPDNNLREVVINYAALVDVNLLTGVFTDPEFTWDNDLATSLGLSITPDDNGVLGIIATTAELTITATDGGDIDNLALNQFLATVGFSDGGISDLNLANIDLLDAYSITATDAYDASTTDAISSLAGVELLDSNEPLFSGIDESNTFIGSLLTDDAIDISANLEGSAIFGLSGNDSLIGGLGNDVIRGGEGDDSLVGNAGDDLLIGDSGSNTFDGGAGDDLIVTSSLDFTIEGGADIDTVSFDGTGKGIDLVALSAQAEPSVMTNIEVLDISASSETGTSLKIDADTVLNLTDGDNELYIDGDEGDSVEAAGATSSATTTEFNGTTYDTYQLGEATLYIDQDVTVNTSNG